MSPSYNKFNTDVDRESMGQSHDASRGSGSGIVLLRLYDFSHQSGKYDLYFGTSHSI